MLKLIYGSVCCSICIQAQLSVDASAHLDTVLPHRRVLAFVGRARASHGGTKLPCFGLCSPRTAFFIIILLAFKSSNHLEPHTRDGPD